MIYIAPISRIESKAQCIYVSVCNTITFESLDLESSCYGLQVTRVKFVYKRHLVKVKLRSREQKKRFM